MLGLWSLELGSLLGSTLAYDAFDGWPTRLLGVSSMGYPCDRDALFGVVDLSSHVYSSKRIIISTGMRKHIIGHIKCHEVWCRSLEVKDTYMQDKFSRLCRVHDSCIYFYKLECCREAPLLLHKSFRIILYRLLQRNIAKLLQSHG